MTSRVPALIASAVRIRLDRNTTPVKTADWQKECWVGYEVVGEVQHAVDYNANLISKVRLYGALLPEDPRDPPTKDTDERADAAIRNLKTEGGDYSSVLRELCINLYVAGEAYLVGKGNAENEIDIWNIYSSDELFYGNDEKFRIREYPSGPISEYPKDSIIVIRIYYPHPRWGGLPISPLRGVMASMEEIQRIERVIRGAATSRNAGPGLLLMPDEASFANPVPQTNSEQDGEAVEGDPFVRDLMNAMVTPIQEEGSASAVVPIVIRAPADVLKEIRKVDLSIAVDTELIKLERAITRLAQGLPLPPEVVTGKQGLNHWTAFQVSEETITAYVEPTLNPILVGLTVEWYRPLLVALGMSESEASRRVLAADVTALVTRPNRSADADFGLEHMAISDEEWRKVKGFTGEAAPSDLAKLARLMLQRGSFDPQTTAALMKAAGILPKNVEIPTNQPQQPPTPQPRSGQSLDDRNPPSPNRPRPSTPSPGRARSSRSAMMFLPSVSVDDEQISLRLSELDRDLRLRLQTAAEAAVQRALERAGASVIQKLGKKSRYSTMMRDVPKLEAAARVGRVAVEAEGVEVSALFSAAFDPLMSKFKDWVGRAYAKSARELSVSIPTPIDLITSASEQLATDLISFSADRLFDLAAGSEPYGEDNNDTLPHGIVRRALYRAGGGTELLPSASSIPGSISTGTNVLKALLDAGGVVDGWEWVYSSMVRNRDFDAHAALNGVRFASFSDPALRNPGTWPPVTMLYPGDHDSCLCGLRPLIRLPAQEASA